MAPPILPQDLFPPAGHFPPEDDTIVDAMESYLNDFSYRLIANNFNPDTITSLADLVEVAVADMPGYLPQPPNAGDFVPFDAASGMLDSAVNWFCTQNPPSPKTIYGWALTLTTAPGVNVLVAADLFRNAAGTPQPVTVTAGNQVVNLNVETMVEQATGGSPIIANATASQILLSGVAQSQVDYFYHGDELRLVQMVLDVIQRCYRHDDRIKDLSKGSKRSRIPIFDYGDNGMMTGLNNLSIRCAVLSGQLEYPT